MKDISYNEKKTKVIAFYLPQYHSIPENDKWFEKDFTEWTNVRKAKPLFKDHYQPRIPADLGYYDLSKPEIREAQARLAEEAGIAAFCYYHYWFGNGKQLLEMPLNEVVRVKTPDFPFCIAWANQTWYKKTWDSNKSILNKAVLIKQEYLGEKEIEDHFFALYHIFNDKRYFKIHDKLVFVLYKVEKIPYLDMFKEIWQKLALKNNLPGFFFVSYTDDIGRISDPRHTNCDATILSLKTEPGSFRKNSRLRKFKRVLISLISNTLKNPLHVLPYSKVIDQLSSPLFNQNRIYPVIIPNWDYTPRRGMGSLIFHDSTPELFKKHVRQILSLIDKKDSRDKIVFLKSWNEWGEGNYMEPDLKFGKGYIDALREVLDENAHLERG